MHYLPKRLPEVIDILFNKNQAYRITLRVIDPIKSCAETLREECCNFDFGLKNSYHSAEDISISFSQFIKSRPAG